MGIVPTPEPFQLVDSLYDDLEIPELKIIEDYALKNRPEIQVALMKIEQYKDTIRLERAKIFKTVDVGVAYKQDFEVPFRGWGPYINLTLPVFDNNYAQVARAEFLLKQTENELLAAKIKVIEEINKPYQVFNALKKEIILYKDMIIPAHQGEIDYAYTYVPTMQLSMVTALEAKIKFYEVQSVLIDKYYNFAIEFARLERAIGKNINLFVGNT